MGNKTVGLAALAALCVMSLSACGGDASDPPPESSEPTTIGPEGGSVEVAGVRLELPAGSLSVDTEIVMSVAASGSLGGEARRSGVVSLEPDGLALAVPGTLRIPVEGSTDGVGVLWQTSDATITVPTSAESGAVVARVSHFSSATALAMDLDNNCFWSSVSRDFGADCEDQGLDEPLVCGVVLWGDLTKPHTTLSFGNHEPLMGHIQLNEVVVTGTNVAAEHSGSRDDLFGVETEASSYGWVWEVGPGIDDTQLPEAWQDHSRLRWPNEFQVWREDESQPMSYCATVKWGLLSLDGYDNSRETTCCYVEGGGGGEPEGDPRANCTRTGDKIRTPSASSGSTDPYLELVETQEYNAKGQVSVETKAFYNPDGSLSREGRWEYTYDERGTLILREYDRESDGVIDETYSAEPQYNAGGKLITLAETEDGQTKTTTYSYGITGDLEESQTVYDALPSVPYVVTEYAGGRPVKREVDQGLDGTLDEVTTWEYDAKGNNLKKSTWRADSGETSTETFTYDGKGNRLTRDLDHEGDGVVDTLQTYEYDALGRRTAWTSISNPASAGGFDWSYTWECQ